MIDFMFGGGFLVIFFILFALILGMFIFAITKSIAEWSKNNKSPKLSVEAAIVSKRQSVRHNQNRGSAWYYVTFQVNTGDRMELLVNEMEYGLLAEGDVGTLTFQGTRYISFERNY